METWELKILIGCFWWDDDDDSSLLQCLIPIFLFHPKQRCCSLWHFTSDRHENVLLNLIPKVTSFSLFRIQIGCRYIFWSIHLNERKWWKHLWIEPMEALLDRTNGSTFYFTLTSRGDEIVCAHSSWSSNSAEILTQLSNKGPNFCSSGPFLFYNG